jgi:hypothetical protein
MRRTLVLLMTLGLLVGVLAAPGAAKTNVLDGPADSWISDPDGNDGTNGTERGDPVIGSSGTAKLNQGGATITVKATGLEPGHTYTMWVVYFNDSNDCDGGCNGPDFFKGAGGGVLFGDGKVAGGNGTATFTARLNTGDNAGEIVPAPDPPPPFAGAAYEAGEDNEFHVVIRSHGPKIAGEVGAQLHTFIGGCDTEVGPQPPGTPGDFPVPSASGECGDVQLYVFG